MGPIHAWEGHAHVRARTHTHTHLPLYGKVWEIAN